MKKKQTNVYFHIGLPRTGTTTLQNYVFNKDVFEQVKESKQEKGFWREVGIGNAIFCDDVKNKLAIKKIEQLTERAENNNKRLIISDEGITSVNTRLIDQSTFARRMKAISSHPKVIITIRKQEDLLVSRYRQLKAIKLWSTLGVPWINPKINLSKTNHLSQMKKIISFNDWLLFGLNTYEKHCFSNLCFYKLYRSYADIIGSENVFVLIYEELKENPDKYAQSLGKILDVDHKWIAEQLKNPPKNQSKDKLTVKRVLKSEEKGGLGVINYIKLLSHSVAKKGGFNPKLNHKQLDLIHSIYSEENNLLNKELNLNLERYGYSINQQF